MFYNYKLLDCGELEKLEQIDGFIVRRPAPQAVWNRKIGGKIWETYHAYYCSEEGQWFANEQVNLPSFMFDDLAFELKLSSNGQIGVFPEQMDNWTWLKGITANTTRTLKVLNGFAYTGAATLASASSQTNVTHVDAASSSVNWAKQNAKLSSLGNMNIRWIVDDILTFMKREIKRGSKYDGIILDPPAFGRSKKGGVWQIERDFPKLMKLANELLSSEPEFLIISCHDRNFGKRELKNLLMQINSIDKRKIETLDLVIESPKGNNLPAGKCARWKKS